jgi:hypothetical protein
VTAEREARPGAGTALAGAEQGAHTGISGAGGELAARDGDQADLLAFEGELEAFESQAIRPAPRRGPGRPAGSPNRSTAKVREFLIARGYRDPMEQLAAVAAMDLNDLVALGIDAKDALALQIKAADALMPYWHQQQPKPTAVQATPVRHLIVIADGAALKGEQDQRVVDVTATGSHESHPLDEAQDADIAALFGATPHD